MTVYNFILQFAGFLLQTIPIILLMDIPFGESSLRFSRKKTRTILIIPDVIFSLGFAVWEMIMIKIEYLQTFANMYMAVFIVIIFSIFFKLIKEPALNKLIVLTMLTHYAAILFTINNTFLIFDHQTTELAYGITGTVGNLIITVATFPLIYLFMLKVVRSAMSLSNDKVIKRGFIYTGTAFLLYCAALLFFDFSFTRSEFKIPCIAIFFSAYILTDCILLYMFFSETKLVLRNAQLEDRIHSLNEQYHRITRGIEESRRLKHDIRHHLNAISTMSRNGEIKELNEYLEAYSSVYNELDNISLCGYHALDNILRYYLSIAKEKEINVKTKFQTLNPDMDFDVTDMTVLIGNLMENAIEACEQLSDKEKFIKISIRQSEASLLSKEENSCRSELNVKSDFTGSDSFISTKHTKHSGQGLKSITLVAEKYGGSAEFKCENGTFTARAVLNIP